MPIRGARVEEVRTLASDPDFLHRTGGWIALEPQIALCHALDRRL
jgi:hypothetical protein